MKRPTYQGSWLWRECFGYVALPCPELWDWKSYFKLCTKYFPQLQQEDSQTTIQDVVSTCECKTFIANVDV